MKQHLYFWFPLFLVLLGPLWSRSADFGESNSSIDGMKSELFAIADTADCIICPDTLIQLFMPSFGQVAIVADSFDLHMNDTCGNLQYRIWTSYLDSVSYPDQQIDWQLPADTASSSEVLNLLPRAVIFYCDILSDTSITTFDIRIYAIDEDGNWDYCVSKVVIIDLYDVCSNDETFPITICGSVQNCMGKIVDDVLMEINGGPLGLLSREQTVDEDGRFNLSVINKYDWYLDAAKEDAYLNGITVQDLSLLIRHLKGSQLLSNPYKILACDVNADHNIDIRDVIPLRKLLLGITDELEMVDSWVIIDAEYGFPGVTDYSIPLDVFDSRIAYIILPSFFKVEVNFIAVKMGDLDGDADPAFAPEDPPAFNGSLSFLTQDKLVVADEEFVMEFTSEDFINISGFQFTMEYDKALVEILDVIPGKINVDYSMKSQEGILPMIWFSEFGESYDQDEVLFAIKVRAKKAERVGKSLKLTSKVTQKAAFSGEHQMSDIKLSFLEDLDDNLGFELMQNVPNPASQETRITFNLPQAQFCDFFLFNALGNEIHREKIDGRKGLNELQISTRHLVKNTVIYYQLKTEGFTATKKMMIK